MDTRRFKFVIPTVIIVIIGSVYTLNRDYSDLPTLNKGLIIAGAIIVSTVISYFLFPQDDEKSRDDRGPY